MLPDSAILLWVPESGSSRRRHTWRDICRALASCKLTRPNVSDGKLRISLNIFGLPQVQKVFRVGYLAYSVVWYVVFLGVRLHCNPLQQASLIRPARCIHPKINGTVDSGPLPVEFTSLLGARSVGESRDHDWLHRHGFLPAKACRISCLLPSFSQFLLLLFQVCFTFDPLFLSSSPFLLLYELFVVPSFFSLFFISFLSLVISGHVTL